MDRAKSLPYFGWAEPYMEHPGARPSANTLSTARCLRAGSGRFSAACGFAPALAPAGRMAFVMTSPIRQASRPSADDAFSAARDHVDRIWQKKISPTNIRRGDGEVSDTVETQT